jgi:hypothetical protein
VKTEPRLFFWWYDLAATPLRIDRPPVNDLGHPIRGRLAPQLDEGEGINFTVGRPGPVADFVHDTGRRLLVSERVWQAISNTCATPGVVAFRSVLRDTNGQALASLRWLVPTDFVSLLDTANSECSPQPSGRGYRSIAFFALNERAEVPSDIFICDDNMMYVFTETAVNCVLDMGASGAAFEPIHGSKWPFPDRLRRVVNRQSN